MGVKITELGITIAGSVVRKYNSAEDATTLIVDEAQVRELRESLDEVLAFFDGQKP